MTSNSLPSAVEFSGVRLSVINRNNVPWITAADLSKALGYVRPDSVWQIYRRRSKEFTDSMAVTLNLRVTGGIPTPTTIFSPRGAHLIAMLARTERAAAFRRWVLDVLEGLCTPQARVEQAPAHDRIALASITTQYLNDLRKANQTGGPLPPWPEGLTDEAMQAAIVSNTLRANDWVLTFDHLNQPRIKPIKPGSFVVNKEEIENLIVEPGVFSFDELAQIGGRIFIKLAKYKGT